MQLFVNRLELQVLMKTNPELKYKMCGKVHNTLLPFYEAPEKPSRDLSVFT